MTAEFCRFSLLFLGRRPSYTRLHGTLDERFSIFRRATGDRGRGAIVRDEETAKATANRFPVVVFVAPTVRRLS